MLQQGEKRFAAGNRTTQRLQRTAEGQRYEYVALPASQQAASPVARGRPSPSYRPDIDGLRAVAILAVVAHHAGIPGIRGGFVGVDVFFVLSGFLITGLLLADLEASGRVDFVKFYARRIRRLLPTLLLVTLVTIAAAACLLSPTFDEVQGVTRSGIAVLLIFSNLHFLHGIHDYFGSRAEFQPLLHTWSLSVEEQFYLVWPLVAATIWIAFRRLGTPRQRLAAAFATLVVASASCAFALAAGHNTWTFYLTPARGWELGLGGLVAVGLPALHRVPRRVAGAAALAGLMLIAAGVALIVPSGAFPMPAAFIPVLGTCLVVAGNARWPDGPASRLLGAKALVAIGAVSYGWYLWHWPVLSIAPDSNARGTRSRSRCAALARHARPVVCDPALVRESTAVSGRATDIGGARGRLRGRRDVRWRGDCVRNRPVGRHLSRRAG